MSIGFSTQSYVFDPRPSYPLLSVVKRYWREGSPYLNDPEALTLVFAHGTGFHKEQWEPVLDDLQTLLDKGEGRPKIREVWSIDASNHGDAAQLNEETLNYGYKHTFNWEEYARSIHLFLSGNGKGVDFDFTGHKLVGIGHSMGAVSLGLSLGYYPKINFASLILCEVMILPEKYMGENNFLAGGSEKRRDIWPSKEEAYKLLKSRGTWKSWDDRILKIYVESGMRSLPTAAYPDKEGVTLKCTRDQEAACYRDAIGSRRLYHNFGNIVKIVPTHLIYGEIEDYLPADVRKDVVDNKAGGVQNLASLAFVPGAGHLVTQINPSGLAEKIYDALVITSKSSKPSGGSARL
ncbi:hypothetical protein GALMADRAFT_246742 [Galerina marginata CBS 339.88]|uniref:AB hydrolase-1 domain-containing protein n=1 Tax=Galerina marginata (strain CBS 339.88) TaxID=685588 RepID=A0A067T2E6_GALM3|nr:hypothetical protein GALMADRAFT_246742 [Galerina marginata CBS 339.88]